MYHRVADESFDPWGLAVRPELFAEQMQWLAANRVMLPLDRFAELHRKGKLPPRATALTFDDGYECNLRIAAPLMKAHDLPAATLFICPTLIERGQECWWDDLQRIVLSAPEDTLTLRVGGLGRPVALGKRSPADWTWAPDAPPTTERQAAFLALWAPMREMKPVQQWETIADLREQAGVSPQPRATHRLLQAEDVRAVQEAEFTIGAHTLTHTALSCWSADEQKSEIEGSLDGCRDIAGTAPTAFAYPYGDLNEESPTIVEEAGFLCACTTESARTQGADSAYRLPRLRAMNWSGRELARALRAA
jgi:peptidoglycan/xylan/chitin deacetylase (PgdA/CDA1 family)